MSGGISAFSDIRGHETVAAFCVISLELTVRIPFVTVAAAMRCGRSSASFASRD